MFPPVLGTVYPSLYGVLVKRECLSEAENSQIACTFTFGIPTVYAPGTLLEAAGHTLYRCREYYPRGAGHSFPPIQ